VKAQVKIKFNFIEFHVLTRKPKKVYNIVERKVVQTPEKKFLKCSIQDNLRKFLLEKVDLEKTELNKDSSKL